SAGSAVVCGYPTHVIAEIGHRPLEIKSDQNLIFDDQDGPGRLRMRHFLLPFSGSAVPCVRYRTKGALVPKLREIFFQLRDLAMARSPARSLMVMLALCRAIRPQVSRCCSATVTPARRTDSMVASCSWVSLISSDSSLSSTSRSKRARRCSM